MTNRAPAVMLLGIAACASLASSTRRENRLRAELDGHRIPQPLAAVWPVVLHLLAERGHELAGRDRQVVGARPAKAFKRLTSGGFQTGKVKGGLVLETMENSDRVR